MTDQERAILILTAAKELAHAAHHTVNAQVALNQLGRWQETIEIDALRDELAARRDALHAEGQEAANATQR